MKKLLLLSFLVAFVNFAFGQINLYENFNDELPSTWTTHDGGSNPGTWEYTNEYGMNGTGGVTLDTYDGSGTPADDWLVSPQVTVADGDVLSFWASCSSNYPDEISVKVSLGSTDIDDFTETLVADTQLTGGYTKYEFVLTDLANVSASDQIYVGVHCQTNGSYVNLDNFKVAQPGSQLLMNAFATNNESVDAVFDDSLNTVNAGDFELIGSENLTFSSATIDSENKTIVHFSGASSVMSGDNTLDMFINNPMEDTLSFYAGILPISYTNDASMDTVNKSNHATYSGIITASNGDNELIVADAPGAYNGVHLYGVTATDYNMGDSITFYGIVDPYQMQTELYEPSIIYSSASENGVYDPVTISAADIDTSIAGNTNPAEQYENVLVTAENAVIDSFVTSSGYYYATDGSNTFRIGNSIGFFNGTIDGSTLQVGSSYNITGIVAGMYGEYQIVPRNMNDLEMVEDNTPPVVSNETQSVSNAQGQDVNVQSNEASGDVYIVLDGEPQSTIAELETALTNDKGAKSSVTAANTDIAISTQGLIAGTYYAYATDSAQNLSDKGANALTVSDSSDVVPPEITYSEQAATTAQGQTVALQSNEGGKVYIVLDGVLQDTTVSDLDSLVGEYEASFAASVAGQNVDVSTTDLKPGTYYGFAVDAAGNISDPGANMISVTPGGLALPYEENFVDSSAIADYGMKAIDVDGDGFNWKASIYQNEVYVESQSWESDAGALTPNNYLISPKIDLTGSEHIELRWFDLTLDSDYPAEHYQVRISTTTDETSAFTEENVVFDTTLTADDATNWNERTVDLSDYAGQEIYIAWIHNESTDNYKLALDSIKLNEKDVTAPEVTTTAQTVNVGEDVFVQSSEANGKVYIVLEGEPQSTPAELETAVNVGTAASSDVEQADTDIAIATTDLAAGTYYAYAVDEAQNMSGKSSNAIVLEEAEDTSGTGIIDNNNVSVTLYPNPVNNYLQIDSELDISKVTIFNALGQKVREVQFDQSRPVIHTSDLKEGIYMINIENDKGIIRTKKFIKQ